MDSRKFIKDAAVLIEKIDANQTSLATTQERADVRDNLQKEVTSLFSGLSNPTLPSAYRLRDAALRAGYTVSPAVLQRLREFESLSM